MKKYFVMLFAMMLSFLLCGCDNSAGQTEGEGTRTSPQTTEEENMETETQAARIAQAISSKLSVDEELMQDLARILVDIGVGDVKKVVKEPHSDEWSYFITIVDSRGSTYYVSMSAHGSVAFVAKDDKDGELLYHEPIEPLVNDENRDYIRNTIEELRRNRAQQGE